MRVLVTGAGGFVGRRLVAALAARGDAVLALLNGGGYAQYAVASEGSAIAKPDALSFVEAAAIPETFFTVWANVYEDADLKPHETLLVHGGTSGIGVVAVTNVATLKFSVSKARA